MSGILRFGALALLGIVVFGVVLHLCGYPLSDYRLVFDRDAARQKWARLRHRARHHPKPRGRITSAARLTTTVPIRRPQPPPVRFPGDPDAGPLIAALKREQDAAEGREQGGA